MQVRPHVVFYDDSCSLCDAEIEHYKKISAVHSINWLGIYSDWNKIERYGLSKEALLKRIHVVRSDGTIVSGAAAFVVIWNSLAYYRRLGWMVTKLRLLPIMEFGYKHFATWRYKKNQHCKVNH